MRRRNYTSLEDALANGEGDERPFLCPVHEDTNPSASVSISKGVWHCFSCGASGRADHKGSLTNEMKAIVSSLEGDSPFPQHEIEWLDIFDAWRPHPYWVKRFGLETAKRWRLGVHPMTGNPTYPVLTPQRRVAGVVQRTWGQPKYLYPKGVPMSRMLFGYRLRKSSRVLVVEGACDAISVSEALASIGDRKTLVVAAYGAGLHHPQVGLINRLDPREVLLGFDDDAAGERAKSRNYGLASSVSTIRWGAKDPGELDSDGILAALGEEHHVGSASA